MNLSFYGGLILMIAILSTAFIWGALRERNLITIDVQPPIAKQWHTSPK